MSLLLLRASFIKIVMASQGRVRLRPSAEDKDTPGELSSVGEGRVAHSEHNPISI